jgi:hypothetical protein
VSTTQAHDALARAPSQATPRRALTRVWLRHPECSPGFFAPELAEVLTMRREDTIENSGLEMEVRLPGD